jgi:hypothetical protein
LRLTISARPASTQTYGKDAAGGDRITQFACALTELNIDIICANVPQAKGRVERTFGTLQDRLVKDLSLANIASIAAANDWLPVCYSRPRTRRVSFCFE